MKVLCPFVFPNENFLGSDQSRYLLTLKPKFS